MFERFTESARQVVVLAQQEARTLRHNYIGTEHVLMGLILEGEGTAGLVLERSDMRHGHGIARRVLESFDVTEARAPSSHPSTLAAGRGRRPRSDPVHAPRQEGPGARPARGAVVGAQLHRSAARPAGPRASGGRPRDTGPIRLRGGRASGARGGNPNTRGGRVDAPRDANRCVQPERCCRAGSLGACDERDPGSCRRWSCAAACRCRTSHARTRRGRRRARGRGGCAVGGRRPPRADCGGDPRVPAPPARSPGRRCPCRAGLACPRARRARALAGGRAVAPRALRGARGCVADAAEPGAVERTCGKGGRRRPSVGVGSPAQHGSRRHRRPLHPAARAPRAGCCGGGPDDRAALRGSCAAARADQPSPAPDAWRRGAPRRRRLRRRPRWRRRARRADPARQPLEHPAHAARAASEGARDAPFARRAAVPHAPGTASGRAARRDHHPRRHAGDGGTGRRDAPGRVASLRDRAPAPPSRVRADHAERPVATGDAGAAVRLAPDLDRRWPEAGPAGRGVLRGGNPGAHAVASDRRPAARAAAHAPTSASSALAGATHAACALSGTPERDR